MEQPLLTGEAEASPLAIAARSALSLGLLGGGVAVFLLLGSADPPPQVAPPVDRPTVEVVAAEPYDGVISFDIDGVVRPYRDLDVAAESGGRVVFKSDGCRVGRTVTQGEILLRIDPRDYELEVRRLQEELKQQKISVEELDVQIANAREQVALADQTLELNLRELRRVENIPIAGVVSESEIDTTRRDVVNSRISRQSQADQLRVLQASVPRMQSMIERTSMQLETAQLALERCVVRSPIAGVVTQEAVEAGGYIQQGAMVFTVRDTSRYDVRCSLRTDQLAWLWAARAGAGGMAPLSAYDFPETPVQVLYEIGGHRFAWDGVLARYDGAGLDDQTRMAPCLVHIDQPRVFRSVDESAQVTGPPPTLMVGMFVEVQVRLKPAAPLVSIPRPALHPGNQVWVVEADRLVRRDARVADATGEQILVHAVPGSVLAGDRVVVSPLASPTVGDEVTTGASS